MTLEEYHRFRELLAVFSNGSDGEESEEETARRREEFIAQSLRDDPRLTRVDLEHVLGRWSRWLTLDEKRERL